MADVKAGRCYQRSGSVRLVNRISPHKRSDRRNALVTYTLVKVTDQEEKRNQFSIVGNVYTCKLFSFSRWALGGRYLAHPLFEWAIGDSASLVGLSREGVVVAGYNDDQPLVRASCWLLDSLYVCTMRNNEDGEWFAFDPISGDIRCQGKMLITVNKTGRGGALPLMPVVLPTRITG